ncbi:DUF2652 domain-containing protein [Arenibacter sp. S6351L]|uniref:DUF2652 domain-containing protein n=1 Tax=Arenibacter sp. S6351L TaxID=2926407 RepID=UPI001FF309E3|nr:DUF2652 domain-containing protein [Arenibacter sp. S6351L]MCK0135922.1 DUF2652 domain-containing protein [Arenibacter sp. S6351L]
MSNVHDIKPTLFFIPDISGFTSFINQVEIDHSTHIIKELLEIIISANVLDLKISEIEGDAVFFYRAGKGPTLEELIGQAEEMFTKFHQHLKFYDRDRICQCGACSTANGLSLKFVSHFGESTSRKIGTYNKLFGPDVTLVHKLLKNDIPFNDYLLFSSTIDIPKGLGKLDWSTVKKGIYTYPNIGEVTYNYIPLSPLKSKLKELPIRTDFLRYGKPVSGSKIVNASLIKLHGIVTNFSLRPRWIFGLQLIRNKSDHLSTVGSKHLCVLPINSMEFVITAQHIREGLIEYTEQSNTVTWLAPLNVLFVMKRKSATTSTITIHIHYRKNWLSRYGLDFPLRWMMKFVVMVSLLKLHRYIKGISHVNS